MIKVLSNDFITPHRVYFSALLSGIQATPLQVSTPNKDKGGYYQRWPKTFATPFFILKFWDVKSPLSIQELNGSNYLRKTYSCTATVKSTLFCHGSSWRGSDINSHYFTRKFFGGSLISVSRKDNVRAGGNLSFSLKTHISA